MGVFVGLSFSYLREWRVRFLGRSARSKLVCYRDFSDCICRIRISALGSLEAADLQHRPSVGLCIDGCRFSLPRRKYGPVAMAASQLRDVPSHQNAPESLCFRHHHGSGDNGHWHAALPGADCTPVLSSRGGRTHPGVWDTVAAGVSAGVPLSAFSRPHSLRRYAHISTECRAHRRVDLDRECRAQQIAAGGFHPQAGWIAFSAVGVGFCFVIQRVPWFTTRQQGWESLSTATHNSTAAFLLPFLMILAAGMIATAATGVGSLEWLYPLRFFAALGMLWVFRRSYANLSWRCDWLAPAIGAIVFVMWVGLDRFSNTTADREVSTALMASSTVARVTWITFRVLAAVVTVPLAEELAFLRLGIQAQPRGNPFLRHLLLP
jgi:hypothetical protein